MPQKNCHSILPFNCSINFASERFEYL